MITALAVIPRRTQVLYLYPFPRKRLLINQYSQVLIALVNGPAIGIAATTLGLFDYVVCSDSVSFIPLNCTYFHYFI